MGLRRNDCRFHVCDNAGTYFTGTRIESCVFMKTKSPEAIRILIVPGATRSWIELSREHNLLYKLYVVLPHRRIQLLRLDFALSAKRISPNRSGIHETRISEFEHLHLEGQ